MINMKELDRNKIYDLSELTSDEHTELTNYLQNNYGNWKNFVKIYDGYTLHFNKEYNTWYQGITKPTANAKELFYTLENIQVDCSELTEEQIKEMCKVYESDGYKQWIDPEAFIIIDNFTYLRIDSENEFYITGGLDTKNTITYDKFMELFGYKEKSEEFKNLVEVLNEELTEEAYKETEYEVKYIAEKPKNPLSPVIEKAMGMSEAINKAYKESEINIEFNPKNGNNLINEIHSYSYNNSQFKQIANSLADLLEYKNKMYGNSALEPLNIFNNKCKVGQRLDDKLARIKNSNELRKNDICDLIGYLILTCKENNWTNFDEFKD